MALHETSIEMEGYSYDPSHPWNEKPRPSSSIRPGRWFIETLKTEPPALFNISSLAGVIALEQIAGLAAGATDANSQASNFRDDPYKSVDFSYTRGDAGIFSLRGATRSAEMKYDRYRRQEKL